MAQRAAGMTARQGTHAERGVALVTGSAGFVAPAVCAELQRLGYVVRGYSRSGAAPPGVTPFSGDIRDRAMLRNAVSGVTAVIHLAARVHQRPDRSVAPSEELAKYRAVNVEGTRAVLEMAAAAGAGQFVHFSSVKAVAESSRVPLGEASTPGPVDPYGVSKLESEWVVRELAAAHHIQASTLRLPLVYGPGVCANMLRLFHAIDRRVPLPLGAVRNLRSVIFTGNVATATAAVLQRGSAHSEVFFVSDGVDVSTPNLLRAIGEALGTPARLVSVPVPALRLAGRLGDVIGRMASAPVDSDLMDRLTGSLQLDISRIRNVAGYVPRYSLAQGMASTAEWFRLRQS